MRLGTIPEVVRKRSVLKQMTNKRSEVLYGATVGGGCCLVQSLAAEGMAVCSAVAAGSMGEPGILAPHFAANRLAAFGAEPIGVVLELLLPEAAQESLLKTIVNDANEVCEQLGMQILDVHTQVFRAVQEPLVTVTGIGKRKEHTFEPVAAGMDIVVSKWIALQGTSLLADSKRDRLASTLPNHLIDTARGFSGCVSVVPEAQIAVKEHVCAMHVAAEGGIFGALWQMAEDARVGLEIDLRSIPVRQETIEICECFQLNPYLLHSEGALLFAAEKGHDLVLALRRAGIEATVIGKVTGGNDRVLINEEEHRFLEPPAMDEIYKVL